MKYVGRLAPSPTGALHLGNVRTFLIAWLRARSLGGKMVFRMEDLDHPKDKPGAAADAVRDLRWLGFDWDEEYVQSERKDLYRDALSSLVSRGLAYPCVCSRRDVEAAQSAPHEGEQLFYPGTCRDRFASWGEAYTYLNSSTPALLHSHTPPLPHSSTPALLHSSYPMLAVPRRRRLARRVRRRLRWALRAGCFGDARRLSSCARRVRRGLHACLRG